MLLYAIVCHANALLCLPVLIPLISLNYQYIYTVSQAPYNCGRKRRQDETLVVILILFVLVLLPLVLLVALDLRRLL
jgi:NADH:ubiquinone oxidoreductase subunit 3 (subunit A)